MSTSDFAKFLHGMGVTADTSKEDLKDIANKSYMGRNNGTIGWWLARNLIQRWLILNSQFPPLKETPSSRNSKTKFVDWEVNKEFKVEGEVGLKTGALSRSLQGFPEIERTHQQSPGKMEEVDENIVTQHIILPLVLGVLEGFGLHDGDEFDWKGNFTTRAKTTVDEVTYVYEPDVEIKFKESRVSSIEMKLLSRNPTKSSDLMASTMNSQLMRAQVALHGLGVERIGGNKFNMCMFAIAPTHFHPACMLFGGEGGKKAEWLYGHDLIECAMKGQEAFSSWDCWVKFYDVLGAYLLAVMMHVEKDVDWKKRTCKEQVEVSERIWKAFGEASNPSVCKRVLMVFWVALKWARRWSFLMLLLASRTRLWGRSKMMIEVEGDVVNISSTSGNVKIPLSIGSGLDCSSELNKVYVYEDLGFVVKIYSRVEDYEQEMECYVKLEHLQGRGIPRVLATGSRERDGRRCLFVSYEGRRAGTGDYSWIPAVKPIVDAIHDAGLHHHDLHPRNIVQNSAGVWSVIDLGLAGACTVAGCQDAWIDIGTYSEHLRI